MDEVELAIADALRSPMREVLALAIELDDAGVHVAVRNVEIAIGREGDAGRFVERVFAVVRSGSAGPAERHLAAE